MNDLVDRYVWAVAKDLRAETRDDVARELRATIEDMIDARGSTSEETTRDVLVELGDPAELALNYSGRRRYLIGPGVYPLYVRLLKILLSVIAPIVFAVTLVAALWEGADGVALAILGAANAAVQTGVMVAFWITLVFVVLERTGALPSGLHGGDAKAWDPASLPAVVEKRQITLADTIVSLIVLSLLVAWIPWQRSHSVFHVGGEPVQFLEQGLWDFWIPAFVVVVAASMAVEVWKYGDGYWTLPLVVVNVTLNAVFAGLVAVALTTQDVVSPLFLATFRDKSGMAFPGDIVGLGVVLVVIAICLWDSIDCVLQYLRVRRAEGAGRIAAGAA